MNTKKASIAIFDSGLGGLTVMKAIRALLPQEHLLYFGDTKNLPYGEKSVEEIINFSWQSLRFLEKHQVKLIVIACHTVCTTAFEELKRLCQTPLIGMGSSALSCVQKSDCKDKLLILGTKRTIESNVYQNSLSSFNPIALSCPFFVPFIEEGKESHPLMELTIHQTLSPVQKEPIGSALLACTHFPLIEKELKKALGAGVQILDPASECAREVRVFLQQQKLECEEQTSIPPTFYVSAQPEKFRSLGSRFLGEPISDVLLIQDLVEKVSVK